MSIPPLPLSAFAGDTFVIPTRTKNPGVHDEIIRACAVSGFRPKVKDCTEGQSCLFFVEAGMGVSFVTSRDDTSHGNGMRIVELADPAPSLTVALAWRRDDPSPYVQQLCTLASGA